MSYELVKSKVDRTLAELQFELARCNDVYRLRYLLCEVIAKLDKLEKKADVMVNELEGL